jgi:hypothetical protein
MHDPGNRARNQLAGLQRLTNAEGADHGVLTADGVCERLGVVSDIACKHAHPVRAGRPFGVASESRHLVALLQSLQNDLAAGSAGSPENEKLPSAHGRALSKRCVSLTI